MIDSSPLEQSELYSELNTIPHLNVEQGCQFSAGSRSDYFNLLRQFCLGLDDGIAAIRAFLAAENWKDYKIRVHAYKGVLAIAGNSELSEFAKKLEAASKTGNDENYAYCKANTDSFINALREFEAALRATALFRDNANKKHSVSVKELNTLLNKLCEACAAFKFNDAEKIADELSTITMNAAADREIEKICAFVRQFRFLESIEKIEALRIMLG